MMGQGIIYLFGKKNLDPSWWWLLLSIPFHLYMDQGKGEM